MLEELDRILARKKDVGEVQEYVAAGVARKLPKSLQLAIDALKKASGLPRSELIVAAREQERNFPEVVSERLATLARLSADVLPVYRTAAAPKLLPEFVGKPKYSVFVENVGMAGFSGNNLRYNMALLLAEASDAKRVVLTAREMADRLGSDSRTVGSNITQLRGELAALGLTLDEDFVRSKNPGDDHVPAYRLIWKRVKGLESREVSEDSLMVDVAEAEKAGPDVIAAAVEKAVVKLRGELEAAERKIDRLLTQKEGIAWERDEAKRELAARPSVSEESKGEIDRLSELLAAAEAAKEAAIRERASLAREIEGFKKSKGDLETSLEAERRRAEGAIEGQKGMEKELGGLSIEKRELEQRLAREVAAKKALESQLAASKVTTAKVTSEPKPVAAQAPKPAPAPVAPVASNAAVAPAPVTPKSAAAPVVVDSSSSTRTAWNQAGFSPSLRIDESEKTETPEAKAAKLVPIVEARSGSFDPVIAQVLLAIAKAGKALALPEIRESTGHKTLRNDRETIAELESGAALMGLRVVTSDKTIGAGKFKAYDLVMDGAGAAAKTPAPVSRPVIDVGSQRSSGGLGRADTMSKLPEFAAELAKASLDSYSVPNKLKGEYSGFAGALLELVPTDYPNYDAIKHALGVRSGEVVVLHKGRFGKIAGNLLTKED